MIVNRIYIAYLLCKFKSYIYIFLLEYEMVDLLHFNKGICPKNLKKSMRMGLKNDLKHILAKHVGNVLQI